ncbi:MAG: hypothetical protein ACRC5R_00010 [Mycoplasmatales bacterium]
MKNNIKETKKKKFSTKSLTKIFAILMLLLMLIPIIYGTYVAVKPFIEDQISSTSKE